MQSPKRIFLAYPLNTPCDRLVDWTREKLESHGFEVVEPPIHMRSFREFREIIQGIHGVIALNVPFDESEPSQTSAWIHNWLGAVAAQPEPRLPTLMIPANTIDVWGLAKRDEFRCPISYPMDADELAKEKALGRIEKHLNSYFNDVRQFAEPDILQVSVVLVDIVAFTPNEFRSDQIRIADHAKLMLKEVINRHRKEICYKAEGGDGGYFVFEMNIASIEVLKFAQDVLEAFISLEEEEASPSIKIRIAIDCGSVGRGISVVNWRRSTFIGPPMNTCARIIGQAEENSIIATERFYQLLTGEKYTGMFHNSEVIIGKHAERFTTRVYLPKKQELEV